MSERRRRVTHLFDRLKDAGDAAAEAFSSAFFRTIYWLKHVWRMPAGEPGFIAKRRQGLARNLWAAGYGDAEYAGRRNYAGWIKRGALIAVAVAVVAALIVPQLGERSAEQLTADTERRMSNWLSRMRASLSDRGYSAAERGTAELARDEADADNRGQEVPARHDMMLKSLEANSRGAETPSADGETQAEATSQRAPPAAKNQAALSQTAADPEPTGSITSAPTPGERVPAPARPPADIRVSALAPAEIALPMAKPESLRQSAPLAASSKILKLLKLADEPPPLRDERTSLLLVLEAYLHEDAASLPERHRASLKKRLNGAIQRGAKPRSFRTHQSAVFSADFSPDGRHVASASADGTARVWDIANGSELRLLDDHSDEVFGAFYSPDGSRLVTTSKDRTGRIWKIGSDNGGIVLRGHRGAVHRPAFDAVGGRVVTPSADGTAIVWDAKTGRRLVTIAGHDGPVWSAAFSPDGKLVVTTSKDKTARIWRSISGEPVGRLEGHGSDVVSATFSPNGELLATGSRDGSVRLWNAATGKLRQVLRGHKLTVINAVFSNDGKFLVTASFDETAKIWDLASGEVLFSFDVGANEVRSAELAPDGRSLLTVSTNGTVTIWPVTLRKRDLAASVLEVTGGCLSQEERKGLTLGPELPKWCGLAPRSQAGKTRQ